MNEYPHMLFRKHWHLTDKVMYQLGQCEAIVAAISRTPILPEYHHKLLSVSLNKGAQATTAIEGNTLSDEEVERVALGESLAPSKEYQEIEVRNILNAYNTLLREIAYDGKAELITPTLIKRFHRMIGQGLGEHFDAIPGQFRTDQRVVGPYRTPDYKDVPELVERLCDWLRREFHYENGQTFATATIQAIVAHVYIEWIHPFGDGNGRTGRLIEFYLLLRAGNPDLASHILSNHYNETRSEYYRQLDRANRQRDLTSFIEYAVEGFRDGLLSTLTTIQESLAMLAWRHHIYDKLANKKYHKKSVFKRQRTLILELPVDRELTLDEVSLATPIIAKLYGGLSERTLKRDLLMLEDLGLVVHENARYSANIGALRTQVPQRRIT